MTFSPMPPPPGPCQLWAGRLNPDGYGRQGRQGIAHRIAYEQAHGPIPAGMQVDHLCHNADPDCPANASCLHRRCVNPDHLEAVDASTNARRRSDRRRRPTHCPKGHPYDRSNTYTDKQGWQDCLTCHRERMRQVRAAKAMSS